MTDVHRITIYLGKFGSTKTAIVVRSSYVVAGGPGQAVVRREPGHTNGQNEWAGQEFLAHAHI